MFGFSTDLAIDLGTANTCVFAPGRGIVLNEPSVVAYNTVHGRDRGRRHRGQGDARPHAAATGGDQAAARRRHRRLRGRRADAQRLHPQGAPARRRGSGRASSSACRPKSRRSSAAPCGRARFGPRPARCYLVDEPVAAAIGAGLPITEPTGNMIVDIGGGTTDIAVISLAGMVYSKSVRVAGNEMDEAIIEYMKRKSRPADRRAHRRADQDRDRVGRRRSTSRSTWKCAAATSPKASPRASR